MRKLQGIRFFAAFSALAVLLLVSGCAGKKQAAQVDEPADLYQTVTINTPGEEAVSCVLQSGRETYTMRAPGNVTVRRTPAPMTVSCFKGAHLRGQTSVRSSFAPREAQMMAMGGGMNCQTCRYPGTITVPIGIDAGALQVNIRQGP
ncbi:MAG: hypothetical protein GC185_03530 [Alphaproteobacteria bacterium]|nr:hypothetical protein [Alphaproteobacteria bacterium]